MTFQANRLGRRLRPTKAQAHYRKSTSREVRCRTCAFMKASGRCAFLRGDPHVLPEYVCDHWAPRPE